MVSTSRIWCLAGRAPRRGEGDHQSEGARLGRPGLQASPEVDRGWKPASVNLALAAVDHFNRFLGLGPANVKREPIAQAAPGALTIDQQRDLLRAGEASPPRDRAIVTLLLYTALRLYELGRARRRRRLPLGAQGAGGHPFGEGRPLLSSPA